MPSLRSFAVASLCFAALGCASTKTTNTGRTAMEQLLISNAVDQSLNKIDFKPLAERTVYLDTSLTECVDKNYVIASTRNRILQAGAKLVEKADQAEVVVELRSGGVGTDQTEAYFGIPAVSVPGPLPLSTPEVKFWSRNQQTATAKIGLVAFETSTRQVLGRGGTSLALSDDSKTYVFGMGPYQSGTVRTEVTRGVGRQVPNPLPETIAFLSWPMQGEPDRLQLAGSNEEAGRAGVRHPFDADAIPPAPSAPPAQP